MVVILLERVPASVRGELTRWLLEVQTGVFVGQVSGLVRDKLWENATVAKGAGAAMLLYSSDNEQGFQMRTTGDTSRAIVEFDGLSLIRVPSKARRDEDER